MALNSEKRVYVWGEDSRGSLGLGDGEVGKNVHDPTMICHVDASQIALGDSCSAAISSSGDVFTWGDGNTLGHGNNKDRTVPTKVQWLSGKNIVKIACGSKHMAAVSSTGKLYTWYVIFIEIITLCCL